MKIRQMSSITELLELRQRLVKLEASDTARKKREEALRQSESKYQDLYSSAPVAYFSVGTDGLIKMANKAAENLTGFSLEELQRMGIFDLYAEESRAKAKRFFEKFIRGIPLENKEMIYRTKDGGEVYGLLSVSAIRDGNGEVLGSRSVVVDITQRKRAEEELKKHREHLEELVEERAKDLEDAQERLVRHEKLVVLGQLAGGIGHELRSPLGAIKNAAYFLNMALKRPKSEVKEALDILEREVATSDRIIHSFLDFARPKSPTWQKMDINEVVQEVLSRTAVPENVEVVRQLDESPPAIMADSDQLGQIFANIIRNAIQAMPEGGQLIVKVEVPSPDWVAISFTDTGLGIPQKELPKVFEPLFTTKAKGIGLGLALAKTLVEVHKGTVEVQSEVGRGTTFTVKLPIGKGEEK